ncbi:MAG TPA: EscR/YscR/HrcR family type III secretion system export apparatus protein [Polyangiaceae bacterium]|nr:EscR/YscR/HrcR family type III secretion system export apparatus protein [Polyangiaceae bacterium]
MNAAATSGALAPGGVSLALTLALIGLIPFAFLVLTSFVKISTVLQIARSALGASGIPSSTVIMALSAAMTLLVMAPVGERMLSAARPQLAPSAQPGPGGPDAGKSTDTLSLQMWLSATQAASEPLRDFLVRNAAPREVTRFYDLARGMRPVDQKDRVTKGDFAVIIPAFLVSELLAAFALGFAIFLPFLVIDLVVGNVLLGLGLTSLSVTQASLPFKLLLFVAADGWGLMAQSLISSYRI